MSKKFVKVSKAQFISSMNNGGIVTSLARSKAIADAVVNIDSRISALLKDNRIYSGIAFDQPHRDAQCERIITKNNKELAKLAMDKRELELLKELGNAASYRRTKFTEGKDHIYFKWNKTKKGYDVELGSKGLLIEETKEIEEAKRGAAKQKLNHIFSLLAYGFHRESVSVGEEVRKHNAEFLKAHKAEEEALKSVTSIEEIIKEAIEADKKAFPMLKDIYSMKSAVATINVKEGVLKTKKHYQGYGQRSLLQQKLNEAGKGDLWGKCATIAIQIWDKEQDKFRKPSDEKDGDVQLLESWMKKAMVEGIMVEIDGKPEKLFLACISGNNAKTAKGYFVPAEVMPFVKALRATSIPGARLFDENGKQAGKPGFMKSDAMDAGMFNVGYLTPVGFMSAESVMIVDDEFLGELTRIRMDAKTGNRYIKNGLSSQDAVDGTALAVAELAAMLGLGFHANRMLGYKGGCYAIPQTFSRILNDFYPEVDLTTYVRKDVNGTEYAFNPKAGQKDLNKVMLFIPKTVAKCAALNGFKAENYGKRLEKIGGQMVLLNHGMHVKPGYISGQQLQAYSAMTNDEMSKELENKFDHLNRWEYNPAAFAAGEYPIAGKYAGFWALKNVRTSAEHSFGYELLKVAGGEFIEYEETSYMVPDVAVLIAAIAGIKARPAMDIDTIWSQKSGFRRILEALFRDPATRPQGGRPVVNCAPSLKRSMLKKYYADHCIFFGVTDNYGHVTDINLFLQSDVDGDKVRRMRNWIIVRQVMAYAMKHPLGLELDDFGKPAPEWNTIDHRAHAIAAACCGSKMGQPATCLFKVVADGLPQSMMSALEAAGATPSIVKAVTEFVEDWIEVLTWLYIDMGKHGGVQPEANLTAMLRVIMTELALPEWKRAGDKGMAVAPVDENRVPQVMDSELNKKFAWEAGSRKCMNDRVFDAVMRGYTRPDSRVMDKFDVNDLIDWEASSRNVHWMHESFRNNLKLKSLVSGERMSVADWYLELARVDNSITVAITEATSAGDDESVIKELREERKELRARVAEVISKMQEYDMSLFRVIYNHCTAANFGCWMDKHQDFKKAPGYEKKNLAVPGTRVNLMTRINIDGDVKPVNLSMWMVLFQDHAIKTVEYNAPKRVLMDDAIIKELDEELPF